MGSVIVVRVGRVADDIIDPIGGAVSACFQLPVQLAGEPLDPEFAYHAGRQQYWSTPMLHELETRAAAPGDRVLGVADVDLFVPVFTFVFGEALLRRPPAVISLSRLRPTFYGLPDDPELTLERAAKEAIHELGHTFGLVHCADYGCVMHVSRVADEIELKGRDFCPACAGRLGQT
ncbi:MAG: archaemetzincin family Zn-dependent metalloprotease [Gemmatimonadota bacterium]